MNYSSFRLFRKVVTFFLVILLFDGCRKEMNTNSNFNTSKNVILDQFFKIPVNADPILYRTANELRRREIQQPFLEDLIAECGMPKWEFAQMLPLSKQSSGSIKTNSASSLGRVSLNGSGDDSTILIPLVRDTAKYVNSFFVVKLADSIQVSLIKGKEYYKYGYDTINNKLTAQQIALRCMSFDNKIFNTDSFLIYDKKLSQSFSSPGKKPVVKVFFTKSATSNTAIKVSSLDETTCQTVTFSYQDCYWVDHGLMCSGNPLGVCDGCWQCISYYQYTYCAPSGASMFSSGIDAGYIGTQGDPSSGVTGPDGLGWGGDNIIAFKVLKLVNTFQIANTLLSKEEIDWLNNNQIQANLFYGFINSFQIDQSVDPVEELQTSVLAAKLVIDEEMNGLAGAAFDENYSIHVLSPNLPLPSVIPIGSYVLKWGAAYTQQCIMLRLEHPDWNPWKIRWAAARGVIQLGLDFIGLMPGIGTIANIVNGGIYTINGEGTSATISYLAAIPVAGWLSSGAKIAMKGENVMIKAVNGTIKFSRDQDVFRKALGLVKGDGLIAHHIIPFGQASNELVQKAAEGGFHINEVLNGIAVTALQQSGSHPNYDAKVVTAMENIMTSYGGIGNMSAAQAKAELTDLINYIKSQIQSNPGVPLNNLPF